MRSVTGQEHDTAAALAARAWSETGGSPPTRVELVRRGSKSAVYRLAEAGPAGRSVIAKRARAEPLRIEWTIYGDVLPLLPLTRARAYGFVEEADHAWLFLEDAGDVICDPKHAPDLVGRWLGALHGGAASVGIAKILPDRGPSHYRRHIVATQDAIAGARDSDSLTPFDRRALSALLSVCSDIEARWEVVEEMCAGGPMTLVHGDFAKRNLRRRVDAHGGQGLIAVDWEWAGAAAPAADLELLIHRPAIVEPYISAVRRFLPDLTESRIVDLAHLGVGLRLLAAIDWASTYLPSPSPDKGMYELRLYAPLIARWAHSLLRRPTRTAVS